jgi:hypothetical protein
MQFHKDHPFGKGLWVWRISECLDGNIDTIIRKCNDFDISYLLIKSGDGDKLWDQLTREVVDKLHNAGLKVYSWTYNYGLNPLAEAEADVAIKSLDLGVDGHVFDAESEYEHLVNNTHVAEIMLQTVRSRHPDKFLAYAPYPIIDLHKDFPYLTFGKYCDAVMPQVYYGNWKKTPQQGIQWMYDNFVRWHQNWIDSGNAASIKPIIPLGQAYDSPDPKTLYVLTPTDIHAFINTVKGYKSVNFWSFQHILRDDCWEALRDAKLDPATDADLGRVIAAAEPEQPVQTTTEAPVQPVEETPTVFVPEESAEETVTTTTYSPVIETTSTQPDGTSVTVVEQVETPAPEGVTVVTPEEVVAAPAETQTVTPQTNSQTVDLPGKIDVPITEKTTITVKPDSSHPDGVRVTVVTHKTHREMFLEFVRYVISLLKRKK